MKTITGTKWPEGSRSNGKIDPSKHKYFRDCPDCNNQIGYARKYYRDRAADGLGIIIDGSGFAFSAIGASRALSDLPCL